MKKQEFIDVVADIVSSGYGDFSDWKRKQLTTLFEGMDKAVLVEWLGEFYNQPCGVDEGVNGEELNWVAEYLGKKAKVTFQ